jgi:hypothetical protein
VFVPFDMSSPGTIKTEMKDVSKVIRKDIMGLPNEGRFVVAFLECFLTGSAFSF